MLNQIILVGRLKELKEVKGETNKTVIITLEVPRNFKNADGIYEADYIDCVLWDSIGTNAKEYLNIDDIIGIKGRLQKINDNPHPSVVAEKVSFLTSKRKDD